MPNYMVESWFAVFAPSGTPQDVVEKLTAAVARIVDSDAYRKKIEEQGAFAIYMNPQALDKFVAKELAEWRQVIQDNGIKAE
ncbi:tripartite tricarboxylate transporter substrate-binding protein [Alicycliphilus denitrificans]|uniref:tripartite tricarboxylate transporter substrate-binding protein n=1 Tax=Alicycliphilus denitrificans TaxID=179636 RepID=UPI00384E491D